VRPCAKWATTFFIVQDAADVMAAGNKLVVVNGLYATGGRAVWTSVLVNPMAGVSYFLERSTNLSASPPFTLLAPNLPGQPGTTSFNDTNTASLAPRFYRVGVASCQGTFLLPG
jgi:hypothetical protein